ncbi:MAG: outer membrane lipoprotein carrier protein LolA [Deltaproteobacteria bacterium]|nr:outer membrane lipoprotein carrier protein LolA [Deltaproteobacteria bacterium]
MYKYRIIPALIFFLIINFTSLDGHGLDTSSDVNVSDAVLLRIKDAASKITTLTGDFVQKKKVEIIKDMPESRGKFFYKKPDCLRWEIIEPVKMGFIVNGDQGKKWRGNDKRYRRFEISKEPIIGVISGQVFAWAKGDFDKLKEGYEISILKDSPVEVKLVPLSPVEKQYISSIILRFSGNDSYVENLEINETGGGATQILFFNMLQNIELEEDIF